MLTMKYRKEKFKKISFTIALKRIKYLEINLIKEVKNLCGKTVCVHGLEEIILLKWPYYLKQSIDSMQSLSKV